LELDPKYLNAYRNRGSLKLKMGDYQGSVADFNQLLVLDPEAKSEVAKYVPKEYMDQFTKMDPKQAAALGSQVAAAFSGTQVELSNADLAKLNNRAARAIKAGEFASAISILEELTKKKPNYTYAKDNLATAYNNQGMKFAVDNPEQSAAQFRKAMFYSSQQATTRRNLNSMLTQMGKDPESAKVRIAIGDELKSQKDYKGAFVEYMEAMRLKDGADAREKIAEVCALLETEKLTAGANTTSIAAALPSKSDVSGDGMIHPPESKKAKKQEGYVENSADEEPLTLPPTIGLDTKFDTEGKQQQSGTRAKIESAEATALDLNPPPKAPIGEDLETLRVKWKNHLERGDEQFENGNYIDSEQEYKDSLLTAKKLGDDSLELISSLERMARIFLVQKRSFEALSLLEQAYTLRKERQEDPDPVHLERLGKKVLALKKILYPHQDPKKETEAEEEEPDDSDTEKTASADGADNEESTDEEQSADSSKAAAEKRKLTGLFKRKKSDFEKEMEVLDKKESDTRNSFDTRPSWAEFNR
jgi:tetratricopeptide (TPR) repeat protein